MRTVTIDQPDPMTDPQFYSGVALRRGFAWIVDTIAILIASMVLVPLFGVVTLGLGFLFAPLVFLAVSVGYRTLTIARWSATPGMAFFGIEMRTKQGTRFEMTDAFYHSAIHTGIFVTFIGQVATCILAVVTQKGQTIPDMILGTAAINRPL